MEKRFKQNQLILRCFNRILSWEEQNFKELKNKDLTLREMHVIEAVVLLMAQKDNKMSSIANHLSITAGSLTTSVNRLVEKGYLLRENDKDDRRVVLIVPSEKAMEFFQKYFKVRNEMIDELLDGAGIREIDILESVLVKIDKFLENNQKSYKRG